MNEARLVEAALQTRVILLQRKKTVACVKDIQVLPLQPVFCKLTWLVLGGDPAARSHRVEQFTAL